MPGRRRCLLPIAMAVLLLLTASCGYHTGNTAALLPNVQTLYVPNIANSSAAYRVGQIFTEAVVKELRERTNYRIVTSDDGSEDATLSGVITNVYLAPLIYDSVTGRIPLSMVVVTLNARLTDKDGKILWSNPNFVYREEYQQSSNEATFFEEAAPAVQRVANSFAKTLVSDILESY